MLDDIAERYTGRRPHFGAVVPRTLASSEHPVTCRLRPIAVTTPTGSERPGPPAQVTTAYAAPAAGCADDVPLPASHLDLLDAVGVAALATHAPGGLPRTQPATRVRHGGDVLLTVHLESGPLSDLREDPRATVLEIDPADSGRWLEARGDVDLPGRIPRRVPTAERPTVTSTDTDTPDTDQFEPDRYFVARLHPRAVHCDAIHR